MNTKLVKQSKAQIKRIEKVCAAAGKEIIKVGDIFLDDTRDPCLIRVESIKARTRIDYEEYRAAGEPEGKERDKYKYIIDVVLYRENADDSEQRWSDYTSSEDMSDFVAKRAKYRVPDNDIDKLLAESRQLLSKAKSTDDYADKTNTDTALINLNSSKSLIKVEENLSLMKRKAELMHITMKFEIEKEKVKLELVRSQMQLIIADLNDKVAKVRRVIQTIELYLGINEQIIQIQEGAKADIAEPITLRQEVLCMDEEMGDPTDGGLDFKRIEDFDDWLTKYTEFYERYNYELLIPESKGVVVLKVRRDDKKYCDNPMLNSTMNEQNHLTYILIRNGQCLYRIWADLKIWPRLFPHRKELQELKDKWDEIDIGKTALVDKTGWHLNPDNEKEKIDDQLFYYKRQILILQGLIDRTEVFHPMPSHRINLMDGKSITERKVNLVFDDELKLPDSRPPFEVWLEKLNKGICEGSRVLYISELAWNNNSEGMNERLDKRFWGEHCYVPAPVTSVYSIELRRMPGKRPVKIVLNKIGEIDTKVPVHQLEEVRKAIKTRRAWIGRMSNPPHNYEKESLFPFEFKEKNDQGGTIEEEYTEIFSIILYNPKDTVYNWWDRWHVDHDRKNRLAFKVYPHNYETRYGRDNADRNLILYDGINLDDVEYYLHSRVNRQIHTRTTKRSNYLRMMPILVNLKKMILKDKEFEAGLVEYIQMKYPNLKIDEQIWKAIEWWKLKTKWKRSLNKDDLKALNMILLKLGLKSARVKIEQRI